MLEVKGIHASYGKVHVLHDVSIEVGEHADCQPKRTPVPYSTDSPRHN